MKKEIFTICACILLIVIIFSGCIDDNKTKPENEVTSNLGVFVNGTINVSVLAFNISIVTQKTEVLDGLEYYTDYEKFDYIIDSNNLKLNFTVILDVGFRIQIRKYLGEMNIIVKNITFDGEEGSDLAPISKDDAKRLNGSNFERYIEIIIESANVEGYVFNDIDGDEEYNSANDAVVEDFTVTIWKILDTQGEKITQFDNPIQLFNNKNGYYNYSGLPPGLYQIRIDDKDGYNIMLYGITPFYEGKNIYNGIVQEPGNLTGIVYYDNNTNGIYDQYDDIFTGVNVELKFLKISLGNVSTSEDGAYIFENLKPGIFNEYSLIVTPDLPYEELHGTVSITAGTTTKHNLSVGLVPINN